MKIIHDTILQLSVRELVEFVFRSGDIDNRRVTPSSLDAMAMGAKVHRLLQSSRGASYRAEVPISIQAPLMEDIYFSETGDPVLPEGPKAVLVVEGRADGIEENYIWDQEGQEKEPRLLIEEIKGVYRDVHAMEEPVPVHLAQAICYAYEIAREMGRPGALIRMTYVALRETDPNETKVEPEDIRSFTREISFENLENAFFSYVNAFKKWAFFLVDHRLARRESASEFPFPYDYRPGQKEIIYQAYRSIRDGKKLFVEAPTGIGKTLAMLYPAVCSVGQDLTDRIFYLTGKGVTGNAAEDAMKLFFDRGLAFSYTKILAKEKLCPLDRCECQPEACPYAKGHFDRVNDAVYEAITHESGFSREVILQYAMRHQVCPYEFCLDVSLYTDVIICDYNYAFAPHVYLQRYFSLDGKKDYVFLIDEAHNLVDRARDMFSVTLVKEDLLAAKKLFKKEKTILKWLDRANKSMLALKRECNKVTVFTKETFPDSLIFELESLKEAISRYLDRNPGPKSDELLNFYFTVSDMIDTAAYLDFSDSEGTSIRLAGINRSAHWDFPGEGQDGTGALGGGYIAYGAFDDEGRFFLKLFCIHPAARLSERLSQIRSGIFFSATFLPIRYYKELLAGNEEEDAIYVNSPFDASKRALLLSRDVSSAYKRRNEYEYRKIAESLRRLVACRKGNYLAFFPSHQFLSEVAKYLEGGDYDLIRQERAMTEDQREEFLSAFRKEHIEEGQSLLGLSVMGGVFSEGIDLTGESLIGVAVVGTGLPQVCIERELIRSYFETHGRNGFDYAYRYPGFNKVLQAAGRLIRTTEDQGVILLMDDRFLRRDYQELFPREWQNYETVDTETIEEAGKSFWASRRERADRCPDIQRSKQQLDDGTQQDEEDTESSQKN